MSDKPALPFAVFDEFGKGADDRVQDHIRAALAAQAEAHADQLVIYDAAMDALHAEVEALRAEVEAAIPAMREYARENPIWNDWKVGAAEPVPQDPNGAHAWLDRNDAARAQGGTPT